MAGLIEHCCELMTPIIGTARSSRSWLIVRLRRGGWIEKLCVSRKNPLRPLYSLVLGFVVKIDCFNCVCLESREGMANEQNVISRSSTVPEEVEVMKV